MKSNSKKRHRTPLPKKSVFKLFVLLLFAIPLRSIAQDIINIKDPGEIYNFSLQKVSRPRVNKIYKGSIKLDINQNLNLTRLVLIFPINDYTRLNLCTKTGGSLWYEAGLRSKSKSISYDWEVGQMKIDLTEIDLTEPITIEYHPKTIIGKAQINEVIRAIVYELNTTDGESVIRFKRSKRLEAFLYNLMLGMIIIAFVYFLIHFFIMEKVYFLYYSIYLFFLIFNYGYRTPVFYEWYSQIDLSLYIYIDVNSQTFAFLGYLVFLRHFLNIGKDEFAKTKLWFSVLAKILGCIVIIENILLSYSLQGAFQTFDYDTTLIGVKMVLILVSFGLVAHLIKYKKTPYTYTALGGSVLLLLGYALCMIFKNYMIIMSVVVGETMIFMGIISYLHVSSIKVSLEKRRQNEKLKEKEEILTKAKHLGDEIITNLSHEFRTPLAIISLVVQEKLNDLALSLSDRKTYETIYENILKLSTGVEEVVNLSNSNKSLTEIEFNSFSQTEESQICPIHNKIQELGIGKRTVLLVEDNNCLRMALAHNLSKKYQVIEAIHGKDGVEKAIFHQPDLIISDIMMPNSQTDGIALVKELKHHILTKYIPIILLTAKASEKDKIIGIQSLANSYMSKPVNIDLLIAKIDGLIYDREQHWRSIFNIKLSEYTPEVAKFIDIIKKAFEENLTDYTFGVSKLLEVTGLPYERKLQRKVKDIFGVTPMELINSARLELASNYLRRNKFSSIKDTAYSVGYDNPDYFSKCFKKRFGYSPSDYRDHLSLQD